MEHKLGVRLKILDDEKKNLLKFVDTVVMLVSKSFTLQDAIMQCIKEKSILSDSSEITPEYISDVCYTEKKDGGGLEDITVAIKLSLEELERQGLKFGLTGFTFIVTLKTSFHQSQPVSVYTV